MHFLVFPYLLLGMSFAALFVTSPQGKERYGISFVASTALLLLFVVAAFRPLIGDAVNYYYYFSAIRNSDLRDALAILDVDYLFVILNWIVGQVGDREWLIFGVIFGVYVSSMLAAMRMVVGPAEVAMLVMCYVAYPFFVAYAFNGLRQGLALSFLFIAYSSFYQNRKIAWLWLLMAPLWHSGTWLAVGVAMLHWGLCHLVRGENIRWRIVGVAFLASIALSASSLNESLMLPLFEIINVRESHSIYTISGAELEYRSGFRMDFLLFSLFPLASAYFLRSNAATFSYQGSGWWLSLFLSLNIIYHLFSFAPYSDRFAAFSWFLLPFVVFLQVRESPEKKIMTAFVIVVTFTNLLMMQLYTGTWIELPDGW